MGEKAQIRLQEAQAKKLEAETQNIEATKQKTNLDAIISRVTGEEKQMDFWDYYGNDEDYCSYAVQRFSELAHATLAVRDRYSDLLHRLGTRSKGTFWSLAGKRPLKKL